MNGWSLTHFTLESSSISFCRGRGRPRGPRRFSQQLRSNAFFRSLASRQLQTSNRDVLEPLPNILTQRMLSCRRRHCQRQLKPANFIPDERFAVSLVVLEEDFCLKEDAYLTFPSEVNNSTTREAIGGFLVNIENAVKYMDHVYCYCSQFVDPLELESIPDNDVVLIAVFETYIFYCYQLDVCGCCTEYFNYYHNC